MSGRHFGVGGSFRDLVPKKTSQYLNDQRDQTGNSSMRMDFKNLYRYREYKCVGSCLWSPYLLIDLTVASSFNIPRPKTSIRIILTPGIRDARIAPRCPELQQLVTAVLSQRYLEKLFKDYPVLGLPEQGPAKHENKPNTYMHELSVQFLNTKRLTDKKPGVDHT